MKLFLVSMMAFSLIAHAADRNPSEVNKSTLKIVDVCQVWDLPDSIVGKVITIRGHLAHDIEWVGLKGDKCNDAIVYFDASSSDPNLTACILEKGNPSNCNGVKYFGQLVFVTGVLLQKTKKLKPWHGFSLNHARMKVISIQSVDDSNPSKVD